MDNSHISSLLRDTVTAGLKAQQLGEKLTNLQASLEDERESRMTSYQEQLRGLDERLLRLRYNDEARQLALKDLLVKLQEDVGVHRYEAERVDDRRSKEAKLVANNLSIDLNLDKQAKKEIEAKLVKLVDERILSVKLEVASERQIRENSGSQRLQSLADRLSSIETAVEQERNSREAAYDRITVQWSTHVSAFYQALDEEEREWKGAEAALRVGLEFMTATVRSELQKERKAREVVEEQLIFLMETTCARVEQGLTYSLLS